jgi:hypothetical protein
MKIRPVGAESFHADGRTDMTKLIVVFRKFANAPNEKGGFSGEVFSLTPQNFAAGDIV